jgi:hypothetical protein
MPNLGLFDDNERLERTDAELMADEIPRGVLAQLPAQVLTNPTGQTAWIFSGFDITNPSLKQCRVDRGVATLAMRENGATKPGMITHEGDAFLIVDLAGKPNGTYGVYIRFEYKPGSFLNRIFWAGSGEASQNIPTKRIAGWGLACALVSPGAEWFKIGEVVVSGAATLAVTKQRQFYFEGDEGNSYVTSWGAGDDRDADRATHGVKDLQTFVQAVTTQLASILGSGKSWFEEVVEGLEQKYSKSGGTVTGNVNVTGNVTATRFEPGSTAKNAAVTNALVGQLIPKAWGFLFCDNGVLSGTDGFVDGGNVDTVVVTDDDNGEITVTLASAMADLNYAVFAQVHHEAPNQWGVVRAEKVSGLVFKLHIRELHIQDGAEAVADIDLSTQADLNIVFQVFGRQ